MNKKFIRIAALILCAVMILGMVPLMAFAAEVQPRAITQEDGVYYFETVDDLKELVDVSFPNQVWVIYRGEGDLVIDEFIVLSENLQLWCDGYTLRITENGWLDVGGVTCTNLILQGYLYAHGWVDVFATLEVTGEMYLDEGIGVDCAQLDAEELCCIYSFSGQDILIDLDVETMEQLNQVLDWAQNKAFPEHNFRVRCELFDVELTENLEIPENCRVQVYHLIIPAGIRVTGSGELATVDWIQVYGNLEVKNLDVFDYGGGILTVEEGGCLSSERITVDAYVPLDMEYLANVLRGVDLSAYDIVDNEGEWELTLRKEDSSASGTCGENLTWKLEDGTLTISGTGAMADYDAENTAPWYDSCGEIKSVIIADGVTTIGKWAFADCIELAEITIPASVSAIGDRAFQYCTALTEVVLPEGITAIAPATFSRCTGLVSIDIPDTVTVIGEDAFTFCTSLKEVAIPESVTTIAPYAFVFCSGLEQITIPNSVTRIGEGAFQSCTALSDVTLSENMTAIELATFFSCISLTNIEIPEGIAVIGDDAFGSCESLTEVTLPRSITELGSYAFGVCTALETIYFKGDAPVFHDNVFCDVTASAFYPAHNATWTQEVMQDYGGNLTWMAYDANVAGDMSGDGVINDSDVARLLWHTLFPEVYAVAGNADINGDTYIDDSDVAYLLWHTLFPENYPLN